MMTLTSVSSFILTFIITLFLLQLHIYAYVIDKRYEACSEQLQCGSVPNISYPFYDGVNRPAYCGYPGFHLNCSNPFPEIFVTASENYYVLGVKTDQPIVTVARKDFWLGYCPNVLINTTINFTCFDYVPLDVNITLHYQCSDMSASTNRFYCNTSSTENGISGYFVPDDLEPTLTYLPLDTCKEKIVVPITNDESADQRITDSLSLTAAFRYGFELQWNAENSLCQGCQDSGGACGYNTTASRFTCYCSDHPYAIRCPGIQHKDYTAAAVCIAIGPVMFGFLIWYFRMGGTSRGRCSTDSPNIEDIFKECGSIAPKRYSYKVLKKFTDSFRDKLGEGGYGTVYRGKLQNGDHVAVKLLKESKGSAEEFINEVTSIGRTNHVNVVTLLGFCFEGHKKALVYDFMPNGSLEKFIYGKNDQQILASDKLFNIAVGIGRGLEYLHRGCNTRIVHFDIKPHNILLDENLCPKISDFGMAKYCQKNVSILSMSGARGTVGFIAPELILNGFGGVSHKSDVYSYGMLVLDMVGYRQNMITEVQHSSEQYFPQWIYKRLEQQQSEEVGHQDIPNGVDQTLRKMILVSLWCIETNPSNRPAISRVVEMLEGPFDSLQIPPMSYLSYSQSPQPGGFSTLVITHSKNLEVLTA